MVVAVDVRLYRDGVGAAFGRSSDFELAGSVADPRQAAALVSRTRADVAVLDVSGHNAALVVQAVRRARQGVRVVILGIEDRPDRIMPLLEAGAAGYVTREASLDELLLVARGVAAGEAHYSPQVVASLAERVAELAQRRPAARPSVLLTPREREIVEQIDRGLSNRQIADELCIEVTTVKNHVHHVLVKLGVERRGAAAASLRAALDGQPNERARSARSDSAAANASLA